MCWALPVFNMVFSPGFSKLNFTPLYCILAPTVHASVCLLIWFLLRMCLLHPPPHPTPTVLISTAHKPSKGISSLLFIPPPIVQVSGPVAFPPYMVGRSGGNRDLIPIAGNWLSSGLMRLKSETVTSRLKPD